MTKEELKQLIKDNIEVYKDFDEFEKHTNFTREDVKNELCYGLFSELTPSKGETILSVLEKRVGQNDFILLEKCLNELDPDNQTNVGTVRGSVIALANYKVFSISKAKYTKKTAYTRLDDVISTSWKPVYTSKGLQENTQYNAAYGY